MGAMRAYRRGAKARGGFRGVSMAPCEFFFVWSHI